MNKDLISVNDLSLKEIQGIFSLTGKLKKNKGKFSGVLKGRTLALIFQKPSNRTRVSFQVGMYQLGGNCMYLSSSEINLGVRETIADVAKTLSRYVDGIVLRTFAHENILEMARHASIPIINGLSDFSHPCQALADIYTIEEKLGTFKGKLLVYVGDGNNVCNSLLFACMKVGLKINVATPGGFEPAKIAKEKASGVARIFSDPFEAVKGADVVYTDVWASMGQEKEAEERKRIFKDFQINSRLMSLAKKDALVMHCLPAHRGEEITDEVIDSKNSIVFDQAENRLHVQKAILIKLLKK